MYVAFCRVPAPHVRTAVQLVWLLADWNWFEGQARQMRVDETVGADAWYVPATQSAVTGLHADRV